MIRFTQYLNFLGAFVAVFLLGGYAAAAIRHGEHIAPHRWLITACCAALFFYQSGVFAKTKRTGWTTEVPTSTGWYVVRQVVCNAGAEWYDYAVIRLERKTFKLYYATDHLYGTRPFNPDPENGDEYLRLGDA